MHMRRDPARLMLRAATVLAVALGLTVATGAVASAAPTSRFGAQALAAGLTSTQTRALQSVVDGYLRTWGGGSGTQIAANEILYPGGGAILIVPLPGEKSARRLGTTSAPAAGVATPAIAREPQGCPYYYFCAYQLTDLHGATIWAYYCNTAVPIGSWAGEGSYVNNQTSGTKAKFLDNNWNFMYYSRPAYAAQYNNVSWLPVRAISAC
jgi:hypothetical protein